MRVPDGFVFLIVCCRYAKKCHVRRILMPPSPPYQICPTIVAAAAVGKPCLVLDLDETLVHSSFKPVPNPDYVLPVEIEGTVHHVSNGRSECLFARACLLRSILPPPRASKA